MLFRNMIKRAFAFGLVLMTLFVITQTPSFAATGLTTTQELAFTQCANGKVETLPVPQNPGWYRAELSDENILACLGPAASPSVKASSDASECFSKQVQMKVLYGSYYGQVARKFQAYYTDEDVRTCLGL